MKRVLLILAFCFGLNAVHSGEYEATTPEQIAAERAIPLTVVLSDGEKIKISDCRLFGVLRTLVEDLDKEDRKEVPLPSEYFDFATFSVIRDLYFNPHFFLPIDDEWNATGTTLTKVLNGLVYLQAENFLTHIYIAWLNNPINIEKEVFYYTLPSKKIFKEEIFKDIEADESDIATLPSVKITSEDISKIKNCKKRKGTINYLKKHNPEAIRFFNKNEIWITQRGITVLFRDDFDGMEIGKESIAKIHMGMNSIGFIQPGTFKDCNNLKRLDFNNNNLESVPETLFKDLNNLRQLDLDGNSLESVPENLFKGLNNLLILSLSKNKLKSLPETLFKDLNNLRQLDLDGNSLESVPETLFKGLNDLLILNLRNNKLKSLPENIFKGLSRLQQVYLEKNPLSLALKEQLSKKYPSIKYFDKRTM